MDEVKSLLKDTWRFTNAHFSPICLLILPFIIPLNLFLAIVEIYTVDEQLLFWISLIMGVLVYPLYQGAIIFYIASAISNRYLPSAQYYRLAIKYWLPLVLLSAMVLGAVTAGLITFLFPALIIMARLSFAEFYCVLNDEKPIDSFSKSWQETREKQWVILTGGLVIYLVTMVPIWSLETIFSALEMQGAITNFLLASLDLILMVPLTIFSFRVFILHQDAAKS